METLMYLHFLQIWSSNSKTGYESFSINKNTTNTTNINIKTNVYSISPFVSDISTTDIHLYDICISDSSFSQFKSNQDEFDYNMRCWSKKYENVNKTCEFISSFVSDTKCANVTLSCSSTFDENIKYVPYYDTLIEEAMDNDPLCFTGPFNDVELPSINKKLCIILHFKPP
eukprot:254718_1